MTDGLKPDSTLPPLREDLRFLPGKAERTGQKSWLIHDPLRNRYFQLDPNAVSILRHWPLGTPGAILSALGEPDLTLLHIEAVFRFVLANALTRDPAQGDIRNFVQQAEAGRLGILSSLAHNYLFFRIPIVRPHAFLKRTEPLTRFVFSRWWWGFVGLLGAVGGYLTLRQWDEFIHTFLHFFNLQGAIFYFCALIGVKIAHELGHAYTATRYGCRVSTMGVAFLVLFPVLFTDTTDSWKLRSTRQRLTITAAGVMTELMIAVFATFLWAFLPDGPWRSVAFFVATTSWVMSIVVNLNPFMRFDGYHFLSDCLGIHNLQARSFAFGRWQLREFLFGLADPMPEQMSASMRRGLTIFAWCVWVYRFFLFLGIALLVHALFFKALGIVLFIVEIGWFIMIPVTNEIKYWVTRRDEIFAARQGYKPAFFSVFVATLIFVPWQSTVKLPAVYEAGEQWVLHAPQAATIDSVLVDDGAVVRKGDVLITLTAPDLVNQRKLSTRKLQLVRARLARIASDREDLDQKYVLQRQAKELQEAVDGIDRQLDALKIVAPADGKVLDMASALHVGRTIDPQLPLMSVVDQKKGRVRAYLPADLTERVAIGAPGMFIADQHEIRKLPGTITAIAAANAQTISLPSLVSTYGGPIAVTDRQEDLNPLKSWYSVLFDLKATPSGHEQMIRRQIHARGKPESIAVRIWRRLAHVFIRETTL